MMAQASTSDSVYGYSQVQRIKNVSPMLYLRGAKMHTQSKAPRKKYCF